METASSCVAVAMLVDALHRGERTGLRVFASYAQFEPVSKHRRIGLGSMRSLVSKGLAVEGPQGIFGPTFKLTPTGHRATLLLGPLLHIAA